MTPPKPAKGPAAPPASLFAPMPWPTAMALGMGILGLSPQAFWSMTPRELSAALQAVEPTRSSPPVPDRDALTDLITRFPDQTQD